MKSASPISRFVAPAAGRYAFVLAGAGILSLRTGACGSSTETACQRLTWETSRRVIERDLMSGEESWIVGDGAFTYWHDQGAFALLAQPLACGDGKLVPPEECDDGNAADGDGCSAACVLEVMETEPNGTPLEADLAAMDGMVAAALSPAGDVDVFRFAATEGVEYNVDVFAGRVGDCLLPSENAAAAANLELLDEGGNVITLIRGVGAWPCPKLAWTAPSTGTYFVRVGQGPFPQALPRYFLALRPAGN